VPAQVDVAGLEIDAYTSEIAIACVDCGAEPGCRPASLDVRLKVTWTAQELQRDRPDQVITSQVLVQLAVDSNDVINRVVRLLEATYQLRRIRQFELRSISRVCVLFQLLNPQTTVAAAVLALQSDPRVLVAQPNFAYSTIALQNDPYARLQYGPRNIGADQAQRFATGKGIKIAVIDTGVDTGHPDLKGKVIDKANFVDGDKSFNEDVHGTLVAGIIAAIPNNGVGIYGVAPDVKLLAVKVCRPRAKDRVEADSSSDMLGRGFDFAILKGANIINLSLGGPRDPLIARLVRDAYARGIITVAAAGNGGPGGEPVYPAAMEKVLAVSAVDKRNELYEMATRGDYIDLVAPGVEIISTMPGARFDVYSGTSMAAPHVAGVIAILLEKHPNLSPAELRDIVEAAARDLGAPGKDVMFGSGLVDACNALERVAGSKLCKPQQ
jgi:subtilisin family serine protease